MRRRLISKADNLVPMPPSNHRIKYVASDNKAIVVRKNEIGDVTVVSNTYIEDFGGIIEYDNALYEISPRQFSNIHTLTNITLPGVLTQLGLNAFENCTGLEEINIPNSVLDISMGVFYNCTDLKKVHIGRSVKSLGYEGGITDRADYLHYTVFEYCGNISEITVEPTNAYYSDGSDDGGANIIIDKTLKMVVVGCKNSIIPKNTTIIGEYAFSTGCNGMTTITIPNNIVEIREKAFYNCLDLKIVVFESTIPANLIESSIYDSVFNENIEKILVPHESVDLYKESWPNYADKIFSNALFINYTTSDGNIITPAKTNAFGDAQIVSNTYSNGIGIIELDKPCTVLKDSAFADITTLTSFKIPESVTSIEKSIFLNNTGIEEIYIPKNVTTLGENVLRSMYSLKKIVVDPRNTVFDSRDNCNAIIKTSTNTLLSCCIETVIPESVKIIGVRAYQGVQAENFTIPNWITKLENYAFGWCDKLKSITIPNSITNIGNSAFYNCSGLEKVCINDLAAWCNIDFGNSDANPLYYAENMYLNGNLVTDLVIPSNVTSIVRYAFYGYGGLTSIEIPNSVTSIGNSAFYNCSGLTSIEIPNSVTSIGYSAFRYCSCLTSITIPNSVTSIGSAAFDGCTSLTSITIPNSVTSIGQEAFGYCSSLTSIEIPNSVTSIGNYAFYECTGLTSIEIGNSVTSIGDYAFCRCSGITNIAIPDSVTSIKNQAFYNCTGLKTVYNFSNLTFSKGSTDYGHIAYYADKVYNLPNGSVDGDFIFSKNNDVNTLVTYLGNDTELILPADYKDENYVIGDDAFRGNKTITRITIPDSVTSIGDYAFRSCTSLTSVVIGDSVTSIGWFAFKSCTGLKSVVIGNSVTSIGNYAFNDCTGLTSIIIPNNVTSIGQMTFYLCTGLKTVINFSNLTFSKGSEDYGYIAYYADKVYNLPNGSIKDYYQSEYFTIEALEDGLTVQLSRNTSHYRIDNGEWTNLNANTATPSINSGQKISFKITNLTILSTYGIGTFTISKKCNLKGNIMSLLYGDDFIGQIDLSGKDNAFYQLFKNCTTLQSAENLMLPATTLADGCYYRMFEGCTSLTTAPELIATELASRCYSSMFEGCTSLTSAPQLPATTLTNNCYLYMFRGCNSLTEAPQLPATTLADSCYYSMFYKCTSLTEAPELPATTLAESCYNEMFMYCSGLTEAPELPATTLAIYCYGSMFYGCTSLTSAPQLSATTLADGCYYRMFFGCTSLTSALELPATTLAESCYKYMFYGCKRLNYIKMLATDITASDCLSTWVNGVSSTGTFIKHKNMTTLPSGVSGIPEGWTVVDYNGVTDYSKEYFTIEVLEDGLTASLNANTCEYRIDDGSWNTLSADTNTPSINKGQTLSFRGDLIPEEFEGIGTFTISKRCNLKGNIMSLLYGDNFVDKNDLTGKRSAFCNLFFNCETTIIDASKLILPATTLAIRCYSHMFYGCTSLKTAPELPATKLANYCYYQMFNSCSNLNYIKMLATDISANGCLTDWVSGVASSGTFVKSSGVEIPSGTSGIPEGWTVVNDGEESGSDTSKNLITFTIKGTEYQAEEGMTWEEWIESKYNTDRLITISGDLKLVHYNMLPSIPNIYGNDVILNNTHYTFGLEI